MNINVIAGSPSAPLEHGRRRAPMLMGIAVLLLTATAVGAPVDAPVTKPNLKPIDVFDLQWVSDPQIAPDGRSIAYVRMSMDIKTDRPQRVIWLTGIDGKNTRPLSGAAASGMPRWSPDGSRLAYPPAASDGSTQLFVYWFGSNVSAPISHFTESPTSLAWSPDGRWLAFTMPAPAERKPLKVELPQAPKGAAWADPPKLIDRVVYRIDGEGYLPASFSQLYVIPTDGGAARQLTHGDFDHDGPPAWSADSSAVYVSANRRPDGDYEPLDTEVYRVDLADGAMHALTDRRGPDTHPVVSPDGKHIAYLGFDDKQLGYQRTQLYVMDADGSHSRSLSTALDRRPAGARHRQRCPGHLDADRAQREPSRPAHPRRRYGNRFRLRRGRPQDPGLDREAAALRCREKISAAPRDSRRPVRGLRRELRGGAPVVRRSRLRGAVCESARQHGLWRGIRQSHPS